MWIRDRTLTKKQFTIEVDETETVESLQFKIQDHEGIPPDQQRLIFQGKQLEEKSTMEECGLSSGDKIILILRLRGCLLYTSPSPRDLSTSRMPSSA
eukprot:TRINITY_DN3171_c0_g1_i2.p2 TRINITY_DN3171_c0_g1~~TRINITY_DN3171_c0_g1_i2.p2  ORF type:complete len:112 (+),score=53.20 TRINITY_DN3171_c0_g1_i2:48-338(+)